MSGAWATSLPPVMPRKDSRAYGEMALRNLTLALQNEREGDTDYLLSYVQFAAAQVRAWRMGLPKGERWRHQPDCDDASPTREHLRVAIRHILDAEDDEGYQGSSLRMAEAELRTLGKRLMKEGCDLE